MYGLVSKEVRGIGSLELESWMAVEPPCGCCESDLGPLNEQPVLFRVSFGEGLRVSDPQSSSSLQPPQLSFHSQSFSLASDRVTLA